MLQTYSLDPFSLADVRNRRSSCCNQHTGMVCLARPFCFFFNKKHWTQMFSNPVYILWFPTNFICVTWMAPKAFLICNTCYVVGFFSFSSWWSNAVSFYFKVWRIASVLLGNMNSSGVQSDSGRLWLPREVPPSISLFHLTRTLQDASLETGDPCLEEPLLSHLHIPQVWYFVNISAIEMHRLVFSAMSLV